MNTLNPRNILATLALGAVLLMAARGMDNSLAGPDQDVPLPVHFTDQTDEVDYREHDSVRDQLTGEADHKEHDSVRDRLTDEADYKEHDGIRDQMTDPFEIEGDLSLQKDQARDTAPCICPPGPEMLEK